MSTLKSPIKTPLKVPLKSVFDSDSGLVPPAGFSFVIDKNGKYWVDKNGRRFIARKLP